MTWSDDTLMAFVDNELDDRERARLTLALSVDAGLRRRVGAMKRQRRRVEAAYAPVLEEPVPDRLAGLLRAPAPAPVQAPALVVDLDEVRAARAPSRRLSPWLQWGGMAAALVVGVLLGTRLDGLPGGPGAGRVPGLQEGRDGRLVAGGVVDKALSSQLASEPVAGAPVAVQLSFVDKEGNYCRTFSTRAVAGLACRQGGQGGQGGQAAQWAVQVLAAVEAVPEGSVRQAASSLPPAVLEAVDKRMAGDALDPKWERQARDGGWRR